MNWLYSLVIEKFLLTWVKERLDKLPGNGYKTVLGIIQLVIGSLIVGFPAYAAFLQGVLDFISKLGADPITDMGVVTLITGTMTTLIGLFHGKLKAEAAKK